MKYKMIIQVNIQYNDKEFTEEEWEDIKKAYNQEYFENGVLIKTDILAIEKESN